MGSLVDAQAVMDPYTLKVGGEVEQGRRQERLQWSRGEGEYESKSMRLYMKTEYVAEEIVEDTTKELELGSVFFKGG